MPAVNGLTRQLIWGVYAQMGPRTLSLKWESPGPRPVVPSLGEEVYESVAPLAPIDSEVGWSLLVYTAANTGMYQEAADFARDLDGRPGWAVLMDPDTCPDKALPWLAQFVGVDITGLSPANARVKMLDQPQRRRGTPDRILEVVAATLTGTKTIHARWRFGGESVQDDGFSFEFITAPSETPHPARTEAAARREKWAPLVFFYACTDDADWYSIYKTRPTWAAVQAHGSWQATKNDPITY